MIIQMFHIRGGHSLRHCLVHLLTKLNWLIALLQNSVRRKEVPETLSLIYNNNYNLCRQLYISMIINFKLLLMID